MRHRFADGNSDIGGEICWQLKHMSTGVRSALRSLPPIGEDRAGPLGPGLLASGQLGTIIRQLQAGLDGTESTSTEAQSPQVRRSGQVRADGG
jgi:hypothetical protein